MEKSSAPAHAMTDSISKSSQNTKYGHANNINKGMNSRQLMKKMRL